MRAIIMIMVLMAAPTLRAADDAPRFQGTAMLAEGLPESVDGRFAMSAELTRGEGNQHSGRFGLEARFAVRDVDKAGTAVCATTTDIFRNGFE
jgi:hypothetical protein